MFDIVIKKPVGRPRTSKEWNRRNCYMSHHNDVIRIHYFKFDRTFHYRHFIRFLNHEILHHVLEKHIGYKTSVALDNKEEGDKWWIN